MTATENREPTALEQAISRGQAGEGDMNAVLAEFVNAQVVVPTATDAQESLNDLQPVLFDREGTPMLAAFTHADMIGEQVKGVAQYSAILPAAELVQAIPAQTGLVVNPGNSEGFEMLPEGVAQLADDVRNLVAAHQAAGSPDPETM
ncbi:SseB family protein [Frigoribacterium sp. 2-23]|uniref:SseB family protein n=1 Tax=Frigoribacterium sp. 2-23 TaxID=3415006 RepID=UPI003C6F28AA